MAFAPGPVVEEIPAPVDDRRLRFPRLGAALRRHGPSLLGYLVLTTLFFWPVVGHFPTRILSEGEDGAAYLWNLWAIPDAIVHGENPFATDLLYHPIGALTAFNTNIPLLGVVSWPLQQLFGLGVAANILQLGAVVLSALGAYLLALHVCDDRRAAFVTGAAFSLAPYRFAHTGHFGLAHLEFLPFGLLALLRLYERPTRGRALAFGAVVGLVFLTDLYYTVFLLLAAVVVAAWHWRRTATREMALRLAQAGLTAVVAGLPLLVAMVRELVVFDSLDPLRNWANSDNYSADVFSWVTPSDLQWVWGDLFAEVRAKTGGERLAFPGFVVLALSPLGALFGGKGRRGLWVALALTFFVLSLGPFLHVAGRTGSLFETYGIRYSVPLPYFLLHFVPILNGVRVPGRFSVVGILALDVLAALALARLARSRPRLARAAPALALALVVVEFYPRFVATQPAAIPPAYEAIADDPGRGAVLEVPLQWRTGFDAYGDTAGDHTIFLYYATEHGKPIVGGMVARYPDRRLAEVMGQPVYRQLLRLHQDPPTAPATFTPADLRALGIGYVVYHRDRPRPWVKAYLAGLGMPVLADDGPVIIWKVPPA